MIPKLFKEKAIFETGRYQRYTLLFSNYSEHLVREFTLCQDDKGYTLVIGVCDVGYAGNWDEWKRLNLGHITDWKALNDLIESFIKKETNFWKTDDRTRR